MSDKEFRQKMAEIYLRYAERVLDTADGIREKIKDIQSRAHEAVMKERSDIATRATYLCLLACYQAGLSRRTLVKIQNYMTGPVADKYNEYRNDQLADLWAQVTLQGIGIDAKKTEEPL